MNTNMVIFEPEENINKKLWNKILEEFPILKAKYKPDKNIEKYDGSVNTLLIQKGFIPLLYDLVFDLIEGDVTKNAGILFWDNFDNCQDKFETFKNLRENVSRLYCYMIKFYPTLNKLEDLRILESNAKKDHSEKDNDLQKCMDSFYLIVAGVLFIDPPENYEKIFYDFYHVSYKAFHGFYKPQSNELLPEIVPQCGCCNNPLQQCKCTEYLQDFHYISSVFTELNIMPRISEISFVHMIQDQIEQCVLDICKGNFYASSLGTLRSWFDLTLVNYLNFITTSCRDFVREGVRTSNPSLKIGLRKFLYETYTKALISQLFSIIIEYPESFPAIEDLCACLQRTKLYDLLIRELKDAFITRLLHSGVSTPDILTAYIAAFRALRHIDSSGYLLEAITNPIKLYLKERDDTVHCVVSSMRDDGPADLSEELLRVDRVVLKGEEIQTADNTNYEGIDVSDTNSSKRGSFDIISVFVNMFGSKQMFIDEYRKLLADRVLTRFMCNIEKELRCLELLKIRFGEADLLKCEVVMKDIHDSLKIATYIENDTQLNNKDSSFISKAYVMSSQFWPPFKDVSLQLPDEIKTHFDNYTKGYEKYKTNRTIRWKPYLGVVNLDIVLKNRTITVTVTPAHAVIIYHFQNKEEWTIDELHQVTQITPSALRRKISYWLSQGILYEKSSNLFVVVPENASSASTHYKPKLHLSMIYEEDDNEPTVITPQELKEEELQVFWSYIVGMLNNLNSLTLDRIFQMLSMFAAQGTATSEITPNQLKAFLDKKVKTNKLLYYGGYYRLPK